MKVGKPLKEIPPLEFSDLRARVEFGGLALKNLDGEIFLDADDVVELVAWLASALPATNCQHPETLQTESGRTRCAICRADIL